MKNNSTNTTTAIAKSSGNDDSSLLYLLALIPLAIIIFLVLARIVRNRRLQREFDNAKTRTPSPEPVLPLEPTFSEPVSLAPVPLSPVPQAQISPAPIFTPSMFPLVRSPNFALNSDSRFIAEELDDSRESGSVSDPEPPTHYLSEHKFDGEEKQRSPMPDRAPSERSNSSKSHSEIIWSWTGTFDPHNNVLSSIPTTPTTPLISRPATSDGPAKLTRVTSYPSMPSTDVFSSRSRSLSKSRSCDSLQTSYSVLR